MIAGDATKFLNGRNQLSVSVISRTLILESQHTTDSAVKASKFSLGY